MSCRNCVILLVLLFWIKVVLGETRTAPKEESTSNRDKKIKELKDTYSTDFFWPTITGCCKIGEKIARKQLSCDTQDYIENGRYYKIYDMGSHKKRIFGSRDSHMPKHVRELIKNSQVCVFSSFLGNFKKCCEYQKDYRTELRLCRTQYKKKSQRRQCKKDVHKRYP